MNPFERPPGKPEKVEVNCYQCNGTGKKDDKPCSRCHGRGKIMTT